MFIETVGGVLGTNTSKTKDSVVEFPLESAAVIEIVVEPDDPLTGVIDNCLNALEVLLKPLETPDIDILLFVTTF